MACKLTLRHCLQIASAIYDLDEHQIFRQGARQHARNCAESMFRRSGFLDTFFHPEPLPVGANSHPHQRPYFLVPGIPAQNFYDPKEFAWADILEQNYATIRRELDGLLAAKDAFGSYHNEFNFGINGWNTYSLWLYGQPNKENAVLCPSTSNLLESLPGFESGEWILFSALNPACRIIPHVGPMNGILRGHLALMIPPECALKVGGQVTSWQEGKVLVFDDSFVHEVWNHSSELRVVLFLNFWHPWHAS